MVEWIAQLMDENQMRLEETQMFAQSGGEYWQSTAVDQGRNPISSGFSPDKKQARKIAISEMLERLTYHRLMKGGLEERRAWGLDSHPTACGFASGFDKSNTVLRSLAEATERWVMSLWIDDGYYITKVDSKKVFSGLDPISQFFVAQFDDVLYFEKEVLVQVDTALLKFTIAQTMGLKGNGIYPGSSAQIAEGSIWQHALLESYRHLLGFKNNPSRPTTFPDNKVEFFANHAAIALEQIERAQNRNWPLPQIALQKSLSQYGGNHYIVRTIFAGWKDWSEGPLERFLY
ncbi:MAG: hypothetical protein KF799_13510 [Bdellovibrionales bacterium]|nr:hypothetical protein [Bdellovibrionales bacterium]